MEQETVTSPSPIPQAAQPVTSQVPPRSDLAKLSKAELKRRYPGEAGVHRSVTDRCKSGEFTLDPRFTSLADFIHCVLRDIGPRPGPKWSLDRKDPLDKRYAPGLVYWNDALGQQNNRTDTRLIRVPGSDKLMPLAELARQHGIKPNTVRQRLKRGKSVAEALGMQPIGESSATAMDGGNPWPPNISPEKFQPAYLIWLRDVPAVLREFATRAVFIEALLHQHIEYWEVIHRRDWESGPFEDDPVEVKKYNESKPVKKLAALRNLLEDTLLLIPDTPKMTEFRALVANNTDWLIDPKVKLGWLPMSAAVVRNKQRRTSADPYDDNND